MLLPPVAYELLYGLGSGSPRELPPDPAPVVSEPLPVVSERGLGEA